MLTKEQLINYMIDCLGYSQEDFKEYTRKELINWLEPEQLQEATDYNS